MIGSKKIFSWKLSETDEPGTLEGGSFFISFNRYHVYVPRRSKPASPKGRARRTFRMALATTADGAEEMHDSDSDSDEMKPKIYKTVWSPEVRPRSPDPCCQHNPACPSRKT